MRHHANRKSMRAPVAPKSQIRGLYTLVESGEQGPFLIWDVSENGLGLWTGVELKLQDKLRLTMTSPHSSVVEGLVCWTTPSPDGNGYRCGVELAAPGVKVQELYEKFKKMMESDSE